MTAGDVVGVMAAGAIGAPARYLVDSWVGRRTSGSFPWATLLINVSGSFLFGLLTGLTAGRLLSEQSRLVLGTGFCGAYTTFSTFTFESAGLLGEGAVLSAVLNITGSVVMAVLAAAAGLQLAAAV